jgi:hypothetical protein
VFSVDMRHSNARMRSVTPGECGTPSSAATKPSAGDDDDAASFSGGGDAGSESSPVGVPRPDGGDESILGEPSID